MVNKIMWQGFILLASLCIGNTLWAQEVPVYGEVLVDERILHIKSPAVASYTHHKRVKILNAKGDGFGQFVISYDKEFQKLKDISFSVYDEDGNPLKKMKRKDLNDVSLVSGDIEDLRAKYVEYTPQTYPYIVEYAYTMELKGLMSLPRWFPQSGENLAVARGRLEVISDIAELRYKTVGGAPEPEVVREGASTRYVWEVEDLEAQEREPYSPGVPRPGVILGPTIFEMDDYAGNATSWDSYGAFIYKLNQGRDNLPAELARKVHELTDHLDSIEEKISALYTFMQANTRYVSIQLGIGGWQTFPAEYVYEHGFGDCKALSNYMQSMLKEIGITSYATLLNSNDEGRDIDFSFPSNQFNHVILCVPQAADTTWLECTSKQSPSGYLGQSNEDRHVLLLTPEGGKLVKTPTRPPELNRQSRVATVAIDMDGNAQIQAQVNSTGYQYESLKYVDKNYSPRDQEKWLKRRIRAKNVELTAYELSPGGGPAYTLDYKINSKKFATPSGVRLFLPLNKLEQMRSVPPKMDGRTQPIRLSYPYLDTDTLMYEYPQYLAVEAMPDMPVEIESVFGKYKANVEVQSDGKVRYTRYLRMKKVLLPPESYEEFRAFFQKVAKADKAQIV
ncbi:MAG: DUF3857 domain-containing protein, partial [Bacteroidota bacterium]